MSHIISVFIIIKQTPKKYIIQDSIIVDNIYPLVQDALPKKITSLKQFIDFYFARIVSQDVNLLKICKFCNKAFIANNPKAEYDTPQCKNKANVYKMFFGKNASIGNTEKLNTKKLSLTTNLIMQLFPIRVVLKT